MSGTQAISLAEAEARSRSARARLVDTLGQVQERLNPIALAQGAVENAANNIMRDTVATVRARPKAVAAAAGFAALFLARKPLARALWKRGRPATVAVPASFNPPGAPSDTIVRETEGSST